MNLVRTNCPNCGQDLEVEGLQSSTLISCPSCQHAFQVGANAAPPPLPMAVPPPIPPQIQPGRFYEDREISITEATMRFGGQVYAVRNITSVSCQEMCEETSSGAYLGGTISMVIGILCFSLIYSSPLERNVQITSAVLGTLMIIGSVWLFRVGLKSEPRRTYIIWLDTNSGRKQAYAFADVDRANNVIIAMHNALGMR